MLFDQTRAHQRNSTVPIKLRLSDVAGANLSWSSINLTAVGVSKKDDTASTTAEDSGSANRDSNFRYDPGLGGYVCNLSAKPLSTATWVREFASPGTPAPTPCSSTCAEPAGTRLCRVPQRRGRRPGAR